ncbi:hypothetical protein AVL48_34795 [Amycolatopsis regifaucium]|uniref:PPM-type phosphatase domain-containing protein n=2 Tax=Amycolatopsis regifaucium TaxID=546365 RepID=A0A154MKQ6_9PSEU|nr:hypothetical protein AVL48_34795 [Amycolatopsis regifaucium]OKA06983.1 hypothetical protein ATP06_0219830 [Amycolatopsis regifaucium]
MTADQLPASVAEHAAHAGFRDTRIYLADVRQEKLVRLSGSGETLSVDTTLAGRAFRNAETVTVGRTPRTHTWTPLLDGTERLGVLRATTTTMDEAAATVLRALAASVALMVVSKRPYSDTIVRLTRSRPLSVEAEIVTSMLPPLTFATTDVVVAAVVEPAYDVGGDAIDYAVHEDILFLSIFDAMGHDLSAGLTATLATATWRRCRRADADLVTASGVIDRVIRDQFDRQRFVTGVLAWLDRRSGVLRWVNRGHPPPLLLREGRRPAELRCPPAPPMGLGLGDAPIPCDIRLRAGDRVLFYTDGIVEARDEADREFGLDRFADFVIRHEADGYSPPETLRRLMRSILRHQNDRLQDDATVMLLEWRGRREARMVPTHPEEP